jgi:RNA polymerase sigma-70 factor (ECF subfamily)
LRGVTEAEDQPGEVVQFPAEPASAAELALEELESVYAFVYARVGNRPDAEDLIQQVAMKAIPRLREGSSVASIRAYLFVTARTVLAGFWANRFGLAEYELREDLALDMEVPEPPQASVERVNTILGKLPPNYRRVLELRFLRGYSLKEVAAELGSTVGGIKVMQLRALRAASRVQADE